MSNDEGEGPVTDNDDIDYLRAGLARRRKVNAFWDWPDKTVKEHGIALQILSAAGMHVETLHPRDENQDPPDCEGTIDGVWSGIEVTELVDQETLERSIQATEQSFNWNQQSLLAQIQRLVARKDRPKLKGGPYHRYILVLHTDEDFLNRDTVGRFLEGASFRADFIDDAFLGLSYHPAPGGNGSYPVFRLPITKER